MLKLILILIASQSILAYDILEYEQLVKKLSRDPAYIKDFSNNIENLLKTEPNYFNYTPFNDHYTFDCKTNLKKNDDPPPTSVHKLRPNDIKVVAALGDSLTAALGAKAKTIIGLLTEYRGQSWSMGGEDENLETSVTMPNILRKFNPNLSGSSTKSNIAKLVKDGVGLNVAVSGNEANHIPAQTKVLISRLKSSTNFNNDWKLITLFIGGNDLCRFCKNSELYTPSAYINDIKTGLDMLYEQVPRVFVNLVLVLDVGHVKDLNKGIICGALHVYECDCAAYPNGDKASRLRDYINSYRNLTFGLVNSGRYDQRDDFTVVVQPFFQDFVTPLTPSGDIDFSYLAPDCFHFSVKGHAAAAVGLWNNMLQPVGKKSVTWLPGDKILCPTEQTPYLFTNKNSNL